MFHLDRDPHPDVRRAILRNIGCTFFSLDFVLGRLRDVKDTVRRDAFIYISERYENQDFISCMIGSFHHFLTESTFGPFPSPTAL